MPTDGRVETNDDYLGGKPARLKARFKRKRAKSPAKRIVAPGAFVVTDGLTCFEAVGDAGCNGGQS